MKYIIILGDGMSDEPLAELGGKTPLAYASTPMLDALSKYAKIGLVQTIPAGMSPGSDTANLSVLGYDPALYYSGRSPLEALSIGAPMDNDDIAVRCNIVTISEPEGTFSDKTMIDHSADEISTDESRILLDAVAKELGSDIYRFYTGTSYRHCLIWKNGHIAGLTPPHDILGRHIGPYLPQEEELLKMMEKSHRLLTAHPVNERRREKGLNPANCCWFWGAGTKPALPSFFEKYHKKGMMVSAVDLLKGIAVGTGMGVAHVAGANGGLHTDYAGKVDAAARALLQEDYDFVYIHIEAPDEMSHQGSLERKILAIEYLDQQVIAPLVKQMQASGQPFRLLVLPDHPTPLRLRTHTSDSVPYLLYDSTSGATLDSAWDSNPDSTLDSNLREGSRHYNEEEAQKSGNFIAQGHTIIDTLFEEKKEI